MRYSLFLNVFIIKEVDINKTTQTLCRIIKQSKLSAHKETTIIKIILNQFRFSSSLYYRNYNRMKLYPYSI